MIIDKKWLFQHYKDENVRLIDCRFNLQQKEAGIQQYLKEHLPGAAYFHLEEDMSGSVKEHGGRHPLPDINQFIRKLESIGISNETIVVAYDNGEEPYASRLLWLMEYIGHTKVYILDGGYSKWKQSGYPLETEVVSFSNSKYNPDLQENIISTYEEVKDISYKGRNKSVLVDSRDYRRYAGIEEPIDKKPGHIPNAINFPWTECFEDGYFHSNEMQHKRFKELNLNQEIIVYCGSGVTATPNYIALKTAGFTNVKVYIGSYSDWVSYNDNPVGKIE